LDLEALLLSGEEGSGRGDERAMSLPQYLEEVYAHAFYRWKRDCCT